MGIFVLGEDPNVPPVEKSSPEGLLALGGDLSPRRILNAYAQGIFPWFSDESPILWWSPDPRLVLFPEELHISGSMRRTINKNIFHISIDRQFAEVIRHCRLPRLHEKGTWITDEMEAAYKLLHRMGYAHSIEVWLGNKLAGGLYGISLGSCFFAESMFYRISNASKFGLIKLVQKLRGLHFSFMDCQVTSRHLQTLGAREIPRIEFMDLLRKSMKRETIRGNWVFMED
jgi:leucyl/phenylalanyl-tRNA--protein transferase